MSLKYGKLGKQLYYFCLPFQLESTLKGKNLLLEEQILSFKIRSYVKELHHSVKQTEISSMLIYQKRGRGSGGGGRGWHLLNKGKYKD